jgi:hypothetical protein
MDRSKYKSQLSNYKPLEQVSRFSNTIKNPLPFYDKPKKIALRNGPKDGKLWEQIQ